MSNEKNAVNGAELIRLLTPGGLGAISGAASAGPGNSTLGALAGIPAGFLGGYAGGHLGALVGDQLPGISPMIQGFHSGSALGASGAGYGAGKLVNKLRSNNEDKQASLSEAFNHGFVEAISTFSKEAGSFLDRKPDGIGKRIGKTYRRWTDQQTRRDVAEDTYDKTVKRIGNPAEKAKKKVNDWLDTPVKKKEPNTGGIKVPFMPKKPA